MNFYKKIKHVIPCLILIAVFSIISCNKNNDKGFKECFDCRKSGVTAKYCYDDANNKVKYTILGVTQELDLEDKSWAEFKQMIQRTCE